MKKNEYEINLTDTERTNQFKAERERQEWIKYIKDNKPKYHLTIDFKPRTFKKKSRSLLNLLIQRLNTSILGLGYKKHGLMLEGVVIAEHAKANKTSVESFLDSEHYHIIFTEKSISLPDTEEFLRRANKDIFYINHRQSKHWEFTRRLPRQLWNLIVTRPFTDIRDIKLQTYYNFSDDRLENYVTKNFESLPLTQARDAIGIIGRTGVDFGSN